MLQRDIARDLLLLHGDVFNPGSIPNPVMGIDLRFWQTRAFQDNLATTPVTATGQNIGYYADASGNGNHVVNAGATKPLFHATGLKSLPAIDCVPHDGIAVTFGAAIAQPTTIIMVALHDTIAADQIYFDGSEGTKREVLNYTNASGLRRFYAGNFVSGNAEDTSAHVYIIIFNGASSKFYVDGGALAGSGDAGTQGLAGITLGAAYNITTGLDGKIAQFWLYNRVLTPGEIDYHVRGWGGYYGITTSPLA